MTRPRTKTVEYFPHSSSASESKTLFIIENRFGVAGYAFWFKLLEMLGKAEGHFLKAIGPVDWEYIGAKTKMTGEQAREILNMLSDLGAIDEELWKKNGIIWSENFIKGLEPVYAKRAVSLPKKPIFASEKIQSAPETGVSVPDIPIEREFPGRIVYDNPTKELKELKEQDKGVSEKPDDPDKPGKKTRKKETTVFSETSLPENWKARGITEGMTEETVEFQFSLFSNYWENKTAKDWYRTWVTWCINWTGYGKKQIQPQNHNSGAGEGWDLKRQARKCYSELFGSCTPTRRNTPFDQLEPACKMCECQQNGWRPKENNVQNDKPDREKTNEEKLNQAAQECYRKKGGGCELIMTGKPESEQCKACFAHYRIPV